jgi:hypothetical protein
MSNGWWYRTLRREESNEWYWPGWGILAKELRNGTTKETTVSLVSVQFAPSCDWPLDNPDTLGSRTTVRTGKLKADTL